MSGTSRTPPNQKLIKIIDVPCGLDDPVSSSRASIRTSELEEPAQPAHRSVLTRANRNRRDRPAGPHASPPITGITPYRSTTDVTSLDDRTRDLCRHSPPPRSRAQQDIVAQTPLVHASPARPRTPRSRTSRIEDLAPIALDHATLRHAGRRTRHLCQKDGHDITDSPDDVLRDAEQPHRVTLAAQTAARSPPKDQAPYRLHSRRGRRAALAPSSGSLVKPIRHSP